MVHLDKGDRIFIKDDDSIFNEFIFFNIEFN